MKEILKKYGNACDAIYKRSDAVRKLIAKKRAELEKLEKEQNTLHAPSFIVGVLEPLAKEICDRTGWKLDSALNCYGSRNQTFFWFTDAENNKYSLNIYPCFPALSPETGKSKSYVDGFKLTYSVNDDNEGYEEKFFCNSLRRYVSIKTLPDDINAIIGLLNKSKAIKKEA